MKRRSRLWKLQINFAAAFCLAATFRGVAFAQQTNIGEPIVTAKRMDTDRHVTELRITADDYLGAIRKELSRRFHYPRLAQRNGIEGSVLLRITLKQSGTIQSINIEKSSGSELLDHAAQTDGLRGEALPALPIGNFEQVDLLLPVTYSLKEQGESR